VWTPDMRSQRLALVAAQEGKVLLSAARGGGRGQRDRPSTLKPEPDSFSSHISLQLDLLRDTSGDATISLTRNPNP